mgnify:CR=1 FL=1
MKKNHLGIIGSAESKADYLPGNAATLKAEFQPRFRALLGDTYRNVTLAGCELLPIVNYLESLRESFRKNGDTFSAYGALDTLIGYNTDPALEPILNELRKNALQLQKEFLLAELHNALTNSEAEAWKLFVNRYAESLTYWRTSFCVWWADAVAGVSEQNHKSLFSKKHGKEVEAFRQNARLMDQARWPEALPFIESALAENELLLPKTRAFMSAICGSIYMYHIDVSQAKPWFDKAAAIAPSLPYLSIMRAELERWSWNIDAALSLLETYVSTNPNDHDAYISMGQCFQYGKNDLNKAIECYDLAIQANPGISTSYEYKIVAWGCDPKLYSQHQKEIEHLVRQVNCIEPESVISTLISAGDACQRAEDFVSAEKWYYKALEKEPSRPETLICLGNLYKTKAAKETPPSPELIEKTASFFHQAIELSPNNADGYLNLALLHSDVAGKKIEAAHCYEEAIPHCPLFKKTLLTEAAKMYLAEDRFSDATERCLQALRLDPDFDYTINVLHEVAEKLRDQSYKEKDEKHNPAASIEIYKAIRDIKGENYEANFQNRVGNTYYYFEDYKNAAQHYQNALSANQNEAVYYDNLAGTLDELERIQEAWEMAETALKLDPGNNAYHKQAATFARRVKSLRHFGVPQEERSAVVENPIRIRFIGRLLPFFVEKGELLLALQDKILAFRKRFETVNGIPIPGIKFADDHIPIYGAANFSIELNGFLVSVDFIEAGWHFATGLQQEDLISLAGRFIEHPSVPGILWFKKEDMALIKEKALKQGDYLDFILLILENVILKRSDHSDFLQYDNGFLSAKFVGESSDFASKFFQFNRMLIKFKMSISQEKETIFEVFKSSYDEKMTLQQTLNKLLDQHPKFRETLPINRALKEGNAMILETENWQEEEILASIVQTKKGTSIWEVANVSPESAFTKILASNPDATTKFIRASHPDVCTVLNDIVPGCAFVPSWMIQEPLSKHIQDLIPAP